MGKVRDVGIHTLNHPAATAFFAEEIVVKCEVKPDEDIYIYKGIQTKSNCQDIYYAHFAKPETFFKSFSFFIFQGEIVQVFFLFKHID